MAEGTQAKTSKGYKPSTDKQHKYGFCPKGTSVIMYHSSELRRYQYYIMTDWAGGVYASPSMAGSRAGSVLAGAWAAINYIGQECVLIPPLPCAASQIIHPSALYHC